MDIVVVFVSYCTLILLNTFHSNTILMIPIPLESYVLTKLTFSCVQIKVADPLYVAAP